MSEAQAPQRWHQEGRTAQTWFGGILVAHGAYRALQSLGGGMTQAALLHLAFVGLGVAFVLFIRSSYVEADDRGLRLSRPPRADRVVAWRDIVDVRREPPQASSKLGVVLRGGEVVDLRISADSRQDLVERWRREKR